LDFVGEGQLGPKRGWWGNREIGGAWDKNKLGSLGPQISDFWGKNKNKKKGERGKMKREVKRDDLEAPNLGETPPPQVTSLCHGACIYLGFSGIFLGFYV
jgi:hypothetical protein